MSLSKILNTYPSDFIVVAMKLQPYELIDIRANNRELYEKIRYIRFVIKSTEKILEHRQGVLNYKKGRLTVGKANLWKSSVQRATFCAKLDGFEYSTLRRYVGR